MKLKLEENKMKIDYDKIADAIYIRMKRGKVFKTKKISDVILHDLDKKNNLVGIEILNASNQFSKGSLKENLKSGIPLNITSALSVC